MSPQNSGNQFGPRIQQREFLFAGFISGANFLDKVIKMYEKIKIQSLLGTQNYSRLRTEHGLKVLNKMPRERDRERERVFFNMCMNQQDTQNSCD